MLTDYFYRVFASRCLIEQGKDHKDHLRCSPNGLCLGKVFSIHFFFVTALPSHHSISVPAKEKTFLGALTTLECLQGVSGVISRYVWCKFFQELQPPRASVVGPNIALLKVLFLFLQSQSKCGSFRLGVLKSCQPYLQE